MFKKIIKISVVVLLIFAALIININNSHPIILKWINGSARIIGKPIDATVYTNGKVNNGIKVYRVENAYWNNVRTNDYLISLTEFDKYAMLKFINIDLTEKWIGRPVGTSNDDYDIVNGNLYQSDVGGYFTDFRNDMKGYNFNPQLTFTDHQIRFNMPPNQLKFDSIRIELAN
jgi:hypothetical protein